MKSAYRKQTHDGINAQPTSWTTRWSRLDGAQHASSAASASTCRICGRSPAICAGVESSAGQAAQGTGCFDQANQGILAAGSRGRTTEEGPCKLSKDLSRETTHQSGLLHLQKEAKSGPTTKTAAIPAIETHKHCFGSRRAPSLSSQQ